MILLVSYCIIAIVFSFLCSILESVFLSTTPSFVESYAKKNPKIGGYLKHLKANVDDTEGAILVLNTFAVTATATGFGIEVSALYGEQWQFVGSTIFAVALIYLTEIFPKTLGATYWQSLAPFVAVFIHYLQKITFPFVWVAKIIIHFISLGSKGTITREEVLAASEIGKRGGSLDEKEMKLVQNLLMLKNYQASDILTPRSVVYALNLSDDIRQIARSKHIYSYSRVPVYAENKDTIIGIVLSSDILTQALKDSPCELSALVRPVFVVPHNLSVLNLLRLFMQKNERFFVVQDRFGQFFGIVTFEDVVETLLGEEIVDEFDEFADMQKLAKEKVRQMKNRYLERIGE